MLTFREDPEPGDPAQIRALVEATGFFYPEESAVAEELVAERLAKGPASGYFFIFAEEGGGIQGYTCYGPIACTIGSFDLYWIAVKKECQRLGLGRRLMLATEEKIAAQGGRRIYVETSSRELYEPTRAFYRRIGYREEAVIKEFYSPGDHKVIYVKAITASVIV